MDDIDDKDEDFYSEEFEQNELLTIEAFSSRMKCPKRKLEERLDELQLRRETADNFYFLD
ncbi:MAG: hypothetical protein OQK12_04280 [Motiliproteus sp.]|nr:hypothetical protein [Motiliproteus sp.]MCW9052543.1 hypothetical protein [Motiliproteus sp.]